MGEGAKWRSDEPIDMAMVMATAVTFIAAETAGATNPEPMERKEYGKRRRWREAMAAPRDRIYRHMRLRLATNAHMR